MADSKIIPLSKNIPRRGLFSEVATIFSTDWERKYARFDVPSLVHNQTISRSELAIILTDDEVEQCLEQRVGKVLALDWRLDETNASKEQVSFLTDEFKKHYNTLVCNSFNGLYFGYNVQERIYESNLYITCKHVIEKPLHWFNINYLKELYLTVNKGIPGLLLDTEFKFLLTLNKPTYKNPKGKALLAYAFWPWFYRNAVWEFWMQSLERAGTPLLVGYGNDPEDMALRLSGAVQDAVIGAHTDHKIEMLSSRNDGHNFELAEDKLVRRLQKLFLGQTLSADAGRGGNGGKAAMGGALEVLQEKTVYDIQMLSPTFENYISALSKINFPGAPVPNLIYDLGKGLEIERATRDVQLLNTKQVQFTPVYYKRNYNFKDDEFILGDGSGSIASPLPVDPKKQINNPNGIN